MYIAVSILDAVLEALVGATDLVICTEEPADYGAAIANALLKTTVSFRGPSDDGQEGRIIIVEASSGIGIRDGDAVWAALTDGAALLLAVPCTGTVVAEVRNTTMEWCVSTGIEVGCAIMDV